MLIQRQTYLKKLESLRDKHIIKVVTGVRRCGKSTLLHLFRSELRTNGVSDDRIQTYNFEDLAITTDYLQLYAKVKGSLQPKGANYIFLDEIQNVDNFQKLIDGLFILDNVDLYITGSNAYLLSGELATLLSGRYMTINMLPLSFAEYLEIGGGDELNLNHQFADYLANGGFPQSYEMFNTSEQLGVDYLRGIYSTVMLKDVATREGSGDVEALNNIMRFVSNNVGSLTTPNGIANYMRSNYRTIDPRKVERMLSSACDSYIIYPANRYDIRGKELLQTRQKYYLVDTGLRRVMSEQSDNSDIGHLLENVIYLELLRRGNQVWVGQTNNGEVDFVAKSNTGEISYYQVAYTAKGEQTRRRELSPLQGIRDNYPKYLLTTDEIEQNIDGIKINNVINWLLS